MVSKQPPRRKVLFLSTLCFLIIVIFLAACGSSSSGAATTASSSEKFGSTNSNGGSSQSAAAPATNTSKSANNASPSQSTGPAYRIKTLNVTMQVQNTRQASNTISSWISVTDPRSSSAGAQVTQIGDSYNVTLTFDVQATLYPKIHDYLFNYNLQQGKNSRLVNFNENVQDVTNDYVDTQSRIKNYQGEQARLLTFLNQANNVTDVLSIETQLTDVEGNIETSEAHLNLLASQVTYYPVTITLEPLSLAPTSQAPQAQGWSLGQVIGSAFAASLDFGRSLLAVLIWILAFAIYIIPALIIIFLIKRYSPRLILLFGNVKSLPTPPKTN